MGDQDGSYKHSPSCALLYAVVNVQEWPLFKHMNARARKPICSLSWTHSLPSSSKIMKLSLYKRREMWFSDFARFPLSYEYRELSMCPSVHCQRFAPTHFWPSLKHLFSRCCSWQMLHDIESAKPSLRAKLPQGHWPLLFTDSSLLCKFLTSSFFLCWTQNVLWRGTNDFIIIHFVLCLHFRSPWPSGSW